MKDEKTVRDELKAWVLKNSKKISVDELKDETPLLESRIISSLQIMDLILTIEKLRGAPFDIRAIKPGAFQSIDAIYRSFFAPQAASTGKGTVA